jgi:hypothetical protein
LAGAMQQMHRRAIELGPCLCHCSRHRLVRVRRVSPPAAPAFARPTAPLHTQKTRTANVRLQTRQVYCDIQ